MDELGVILKLAVAITFIFAGFSKLLWIRECSAFARDIGIFPRKIGAVLGFLMPLAELAVGTGLIFSNNVLINIMAFGIVLFFIVLNLKSIIERQEKDCFCYGKIIKTKLSKGGLIHYLYILGALIFSNFIIRKGAADILFNTSSLDMFIIIIISALVFINGIVMQMVLDKLA